MRRIAPYAILAVLTGTLVGAVMLWIALKENLHGDLIDQQTGAIDFGYSALLFLSWVVPISAIVAVIEATVYVVGRIARIWK